VNGGGKNGAGAAAGRARETATVLHKRQRRHSSGNPETTRRSLAGCGGVRVPAVVQPHAQRRLPLGASLLPPRLHGVRARGRGGAGRLQAALHGVRPTGAESTRRVGAS